MNEDVGILLKNEDFPASHVLVFRDVFTEMEQPTQMIHAFFILPRSNAGGFFPNKKEAHPSLMQKKLMPKKKQTEVTYSIEEWICNISSNMYL